jgi:hypothetical protein
MSFIMRIAIVILCAYAGSAVAASQFAELPDANQMARK